MFSSSSEQHGFYNGSWTATNAFLLSDYVSYSLEKRRSVACIYTDLSKALNRVNIVRLLHKLKTTGIGHSIISIILYYRGCIHFLLLASSTSR